MAKLPHVSPLQQAMDVPRIRANSLAGCAAPLVSVAVGRLF